MSAKRTWDELVAAGRAAVAALSRSKWELGDLALEIAPMGKQGERFDDATSDRLGRFADEIGLDLYHRLSEYRQVAARWPNTARAGSVSWAVHRTLMYEDDRHELIRSRGSWTCREVSAVMTERRRAADKALKAQLATVAAQSPAPPNHPDLPRVIFNDDDEPNPEFEPLTPEDFDNLASALQRLAFRLTQHPYAAWGADGLRLALDQLGVMSSALIQVEADLASALAEVEGET